MGSSPLIPKDKVSSLTIGSTDARHIASSTQPQHIDDFWLQGTSTSPVYSTPVAKHIFSVNITLFRAYRERRIIISMFLKNWKKINASDIDKNATSRAT